MVPHHADCFIDTARIPPCSPITFLADYVAELAQLVVGRDVAKEFTVMGVVNSNRVTDATASLCVSGVLGPLLPLGAFTG